MSLRLIFIKTKEFQGRLAGVLKKREVLQHFPQIVWKSWGDTCISQTP